MKNKFVRLLSIGSIVTTLMSACYYHDNEPGELQSGRTKTRVKSVCLMLESYRNDNGGFPEAKDGFDAFVDRNDKATEGMVLIDGWKHQLRPVVSGSLITGAYSIGMNGIDEGGKGDDIICRVFGAIG